MAIHPGSRWLEQHWLQVKPGSWVAVRAGGVAAEDLDLPKLYASLRSLSIPLADVTIAYVPSPGEVLQ
jgi:hypothetical protein